MKIIKQRSKILKITQVFFLTCLLFSNLPITPSYADFKDHFRECTPAGGNISIVNPAPTGGLQFSNDDGGEDFTFDPYNGYCMAVVLPPYLVLKAAIMTMNINCGTGSNAGNARWGRLYPTPLHDAIDIARALSKPSPNAVCKGATVAARAALTSFIGGVSIQYSLAKDAFENTAICGGGVDDNWMRWNSQYMIKNVPDRKKTVENIITGWVRNCNAAPTTSTDCDKLNEGMLHKDYRQWFYGGVERQDNSDSACPDVTREPVTTATTDTPVDHIVIYNGHEYPAQRYYMRGTEPGNYACDRFNYRLSRTNNVNIETYKFAHQCCIDKSKTNICIERKYCSAGGYVGVCPDSANNLKTEHIFCQAGSDNCSIGSNLNRASFDAVYHDSNRMICASTNNFCPYDFNLGGGSVNCNFFKDGQTNEDTGIFTPVSTTNIAASTCSTTSEIRDSSCSFNNKAGKCKNYCQYLNHCVIVGGNDYVYSSEITSPYFSTACLNFVGDSKNDHSYGAPKFPGDISITGTQKHFTAPIAQCVRETLENVFYNRAGHTKCENPQEYPNPEGNCTTGNYLYKKGLPVTEQSFFSFIQDNVKDAIRLALTVSIMLQGFKILLTGQVLKQSELMMYVMKIGLVLYFATGTAWQGFFFDGVYNASATFSTIVMNIRTSPNEIQRDGCQFGKISFTDGSSSYVATSGTNISPIYPSGKQYLAVFDSFDCKIARYLGYGTFSNVATIAKLIVPALLSPAVGAIGIYFAVLTLMFGIFMIIAAFRALHIFLTSAFSIILLVYISPITITCALFNKSKPIFEKWLINLIGFSLQPIILFAYIGFFLTAFEFLVAGSATYSGQSPTKTIVCDKMCKTAQGVITPYVANTCDEDNGSTVLDPMSDSIACMMNLKNENFGSIPVLEPLGIAIPILKNFFSENGRQKILAMMKALLIIYILASFIDQIPEIASDLMGGLKMPTYDMNALSMAKKAAFLLNAIQQRGAGAAMKAGGVAMGMSKSVAREGGTTSKAKPGDGKPEG